MYRQSCLGIEFVGASIARPRADASIGPYTMRVVYLVGADSISVRGVYRARCYAAAGCWVKIFMDCL